jgi:hypothetical protein
LTKLEPLVISPWFPCESARTVTIVRLVKFAK